MDCYEVEIEGSKMKVTVIESPNLLDTYISELSDYFAQRRANSAGVIDVVGLDVHTDTYNRPLRLVIYVPNRILIIQWKNFNWVPESLIKLLGGNESSGTIYLVGSNIERKISMILSWYHRSHTTSARIGVEIGYLAARVLKKPGLEMCGLGELGGMVGINTSTSSLLGVGVGWGNAKLPNQYIGQFSEEGIKCVILKAYTCYTIGRKLVLGKFAPR